MSAATILEGQLHAHIHNAMEGFNARAQLALAEDKIRELHARLVADENAGAVYAVVAARPALLELAALNPEIAVTVRDMYDGVTDVETLLMYRGEALRRAADFLTEVEHIDRLLGVLQ